jgi:hypothetical protein
MVAVDYETIVDEHGVPWIGGHDAMVHLGVTPSYLRKLARSGKLSQKELGPRCYLYVFDEIEQFRRSPPQSGRKRSGARKA